MEQNLGDGQMGGGRPTPPTPPPPPGYGPGVVRLYSSFMLNIVRRLTWGDNRFALVKVYWDTLALS